MARFIVTDANHAVASVAYRSAEVIAIYPITPASTMGEHADAWSSRGRLNLWGERPTVIEMQSEGGAAGVVHGALQAGALATTFTASQGLLLMIPDLYKIAGELTAFCMHVAARTIATHALSIFGDHSDVMACRQTGMMLLASGSVQEAQDLAVIGHAATLRARIPVLHFFDGFRTSHETQKIEAVEDDDLRALYDEGSIAEHRARALSPDHPVIRGTAQNPDVFFQAREAINLYYDAAPAHVEEAMARFAARTGRHYRLFDYHGHPEAERVVIVMGSAASVVHEAVDVLVAAGERVGVLKVRLYRPFSASALLASLPREVRAIAVLDRTKEPGAPGDPLFLDVVTVLAEARAMRTSPLTGDPRVIAGRYGLSSKEFSPGMAKAVFDELAQPSPRARFTVGIRDDVTRRSILWDESFGAEDPETKCAIVFGLGSDGTVGATKTAVEVIGGSTPSYVQSYSIYDSKKSGSVTITHVRVSPRPILSSFLVRDAHYIACHQPALLDRLDVLERAAKGGTFLLNTPEPPEQAWEHLPREVEDIIIERGLRFFVVDGSKVAAEAGLGGHLGTVMLACFFALAGVMDRDVAMERFGEAVSRELGKRGEAVVKKNLTAIAAAASRIHEVNVLGRAESRRHRPPVVPPEAPEFVQRVTAMMLAGKGDLLPVSAFPVDGTWPVGTSRWEKRNLARELPRWDASICVECNYCALFCPHAAIRAKVFDPAALKEAPEGTPTLKWRAGALAGQAYTLAVSPDDCTGCGVCVEVCPGKDKKNPSHRSLEMVPVADEREAALSRFAFFETVPYARRDKVHLDVKGSQLLQPLIEYSGACSGCGETPYLKLITQLFGDRALIANATGCSSIFGGNLPTTPYCSTAEGRGPAWANSLFEDDAEFGLGFRLAVDMHLELATILLKRLAPQVGEELVTELLAPQPTTEEALSAQRERVATLRTRLAPIEGAEARRLSLAADALVPKSVWIVGGDGWAYDIGFGGLDHVLASGHKVNVLVLDTEVYSNTGGQQSKATPLGATARFAASGKEMGKKDLGMMVMTYGHVYVASVAMGAKPAQALTALREAEAYPGPSLVIAYSPCIAHGYDLGEGPEMQRLAVSSGVWPLYRFDPRRMEQGEPPLVLESGELKVSVRDYMARQERFRSVALRDPERHAHLVEAAERWVAKRRALYEKLAAIGPAR